MRDWESHRIGGGRKEDIDCNKIWDVECSDSSTDLRLPRTEISTHGRNGENTRDRASRFQSPRSNYVPNEVKPRVQICRASTNSKKRPSLAREWDQNWYHGYLFTISGSHLPREDRNFCRKNFPRLQSAPWSMTSEYHWIIFVQRGSERLAVGHYVEGRKINSSKCAFYMEIPEIFVDRGRRRRVLGGGERRNERCWV